MDPAYLKILHPKPEMFRFVGQVRVLDIFQNNTRDFHDDGLFSTTIFGRVGSDERLTRMGYIDVYVPIFHPRIFNHICTLKQLYKGILSGKEYAVWNPQLKDFEKSDKLNGQTGFYFFLKHWEEINFARTASNRRDAKIEIVRKNKDIALTSKIVVLPAGLRDLEVDEFGGIDQHEINDFYRTLIRISSTLSTIKDLDSPIIDRARYSLQLAFNELHDYIVSMLVKGKNSFAMAKFGRRRIRYGTRNVLGAVSATCKHLDDPVYSGPDDTRVGLFQAIKATEPLFIHHLKSTYLNHIFRGEGYAWLVDPKTLERKEVAMKPKSIDKWTTIEGLGKIINGFQNTHLRNQPIMIDGHYLGLIYKRDNHYKLVLSIDEVRAERADDIKYISPITYGELFFIIANIYCRETPFDVTRYPVEGAGSIYTSNIYLTTTAKSLEMTRLDDNWEVTDNRTINFPDITSQKWVDTMGPFSSRLADMGGDFDGDTGNGNANLSEESKAAAKAHMNSLSYHISSNNRMMGSPMFDVIQRVIISMTGD